MPCATQGLGVKHRASAFLLLTASHLPLLPLLPLPLPSDLNTTFLEPSNGYFWVGKIYTDIWSDRER